MLNPHALRTAARGVAERIAPLEASLDDGFSQTASLLAYLPGARVAANLPMAMGQVALMRVLASLNAIAQAREEIVAAHAEFVRTGTELRLPETGFGSLGGCPPSNRLAVVTGHTA
jgi:hypothetical protein